MATRTAIQRIPKGDFDPVALRSAVALWSDATTDATSARRLDLVRDKTRAVEGFFAFAGRRPADVTPLDVRRWQRELERRGQKPATVYSKVSKLSSFFAWAIGKTPLRRVMTDNPVRLARPKAPRAFGSESVAALDDEQARSLAATIGRLASVDGALVAKRDYALVLFFMLTGMRRAEVIGLRGKHVRFTDAALIIRSRVKGGDFVAREVRDPLLRTALVDYLTACRRRSTIGRDLPLWLRHDRGSEAVERRAALTSHAFSRNLKLYAEMAGIGPIHLHQLRHTFARMVAEQSGSLTETQEALGHRHLSTTRVYVQRVGVKRDRFSSVVSRILDLDRTDE